MSQEELVFENEFYGVYTGKSMVEEGMRAYKIINKKYGIVEVETTILPRAISLAKDYADYMNRLNSDQEAEDTRGAIEEDGDMLQFTVPAEMEVRLSNDDPPPSVG